VSFGQRLHSRLPAPYKKQYKANYRLRLDKSDNSGPIASSQIRGQNLRGLVYMSSFDIRSLPPQLNITDHFLDSEQPKNDEDSTGGHEVHPRHGG
jgi:hypothetical protein